MKDTSWRVTQVADFPDSTTMNRILPRQLKFEVAENWSSLHLSETHPPRQQEYCEEESTASSSTSNPSDISWEPSAGSSCSESIDESLDDGNAGLATEFQRESLLRTRKLMTDHSETYLGISKDNLSVLNLIAYKLPYRAKGFLTSLDIVSLIIRKICLNESFEILAIEFGISKSSASGLFLKYVAFVGDHLGELIVSPSVESVKKMLPVSFRKSFSGAHYVVDAFETAIQKSSKPPNQTLSWSNYKHNNTMKNLIAVTPDGLIALPALLCQMPHCQV